MKTQILRLFCPLSVMAGMFYVGNVASAQGSLPGSSSPPANDSIPRRIGKDTPVKDVLANPRLLFRATLERKTTTVEQALAKLSEFTTLHLEAQGAELRVTVLYFHYTATPLRDILAGIAATGNWEWTKKNENTLVLKERYNAHALDVHRPRNEAQKEVYELGATFLGQFADLPPDIQAAMGFNGETQDGALHPGLPFNTLPTAMQDNVRAMLAAQTKNMASQGIGFPSLSESGLSHSLVNLQYGSPQDGLRSFGVGLSANLANGDRASLGMDFIVFQDPRDGNNVVPGDQVAGIDNNSAALDATSRQKALAGNPHLQDKVSLTLENASLFQTLKALSVKANIAFSAQYPSMTAKPVQRSFTFTAISIGEMLDKITALYGGRDDQGNRYRYTWGQHGQPTSQVFVFHISLDERPSEEQPPAP